MAAALAGVALPIVALLQVHGLLLWVFITIGVCMVVASVTEVATYPTRRAKAAREAGEEQKEPAGSSPCSDQLPPDFARVFGPFDRRTQEIHEARMNWVFGKLP